MENILPSDEDMTVLLDVMHKGKATQIDRVRFMRGAVYRGAIARGKTEAEATQLAQSEHVAELGLDVRVE